MTSCPTYMQGSAGHVLGGGSQGEREEEVDRIVQGVGQYMD